VPDDFAETRRHVEEIDRLIRAACFAAPGLPRDIKRYNARRDDLLARGDSNPEGTIYAETPGDWAAYIRAVNAGVTAEALWLPRSAIEDWGVREQGIGGEWDVDPAGRGAPIRWRQRPLKATGHGGETTVWVRVRDAEGDGDSRCVEHWRVTWRAFAAAVRRGIQDHVDALNGLDRVCPWLALPESWKRGIDLERFAGAGRWSAHDSDAAWAELNVARTLMDCRQASDADADATPNVSEAPERFRKIERATGEPEPLQQGHVTLRLRKRCIEIRIDGKIRQHPLEPRHRDILAIMWPAKKVEATKAELVQGVTPWRKRGSVGDKTLRNALSAINDALIECFNSTGISTPWMLEASGGEENRVVEKSYTDTVSGPARQ